MFCMRGRGIRICSGYVLYVGEGDKNMPDIFCMRGREIKICPDMFCMWGDKNMPGYVLHAGECRKD